MGTRWSRSVSVFVLILGVLFFLPLPTMARVLLEASGEITPTGSLPSTGFQRHELVHDQQSGATLSVPAQDDSELKYRLGAALARLRARRHQRTVGDEGLVVADPQIPAVAPAAPVLVPAPAAEPHGGVEPPRPAPGPSFSGVDASGEVIPPYAARNPYEIPSQPVVSSPTPAPAPDEILVPNQPRQVFVRAPNTDVPVVLPGNESKFDDPASVPAVSAPPAPDSPQMDAGSTFTRILVKMQRKKADRLRVAQQHGVLLPSQGGSLEKVSPALSRVNGSLKTLISRLA